ncbi:13418_t:CDS:2 [Acaulospora colombiana]|uniref:13418_t:CDS:1 n=1 Tax=Acaulospora colombiana TaxID=27376 RepID=A0ACA9NNY4_9GLOM|nr:13418_t:CDS:2 [Acaulospora colombiana]
MSQKVDQDIQEPEKQVKEVVEVERGDRTADLEELSTPVVYKLYKRRWLGIVSLVRSSKQFLHYVGRFADRQFEHRVLCRELTSSKQYREPSLSPGDVPDRPYHEEDWNKENGKILLGGVWLLLANWIRVASIAPKLSPDGKFAILMLAQICVAFAQGCCQIITENQHTTTWYGLLIYP